MSAEEIQRYREKVGEIQKIEIHSERYKKIERQSKCNRERDRERGIG